jgi:hypothetical protein
MRTLASYPVFNHPIRRLEGKWIAVSVPSKLATLPSVASEPENTQRQIALVLDIVYNSIRFHSRLRAAE